jgi:C-terminal region of aryl-sulfatase
MPAFAYWKGQIEPHSRSAEIVSSLDIFPTLSNLASVPLDPNRTYDGRDMTEILLHNSSSSTTTATRGQYPKEDVSSSSVSNQGRSKHEFLFFYGTCHQPTQPYYTVTAVRHGPYKAHWCTGPGLAGGENATLIRVYDQLPLLFQVEHDPSEAYPIVHGNEWPTDTTHRAAMERIVKAYAMERSTFSFGTLDPYPDGPGEGPGLYGVCCDRTKDCNCAAPPLQRARSQVDIDGSLDEGSGILNIGTKWHHDQYHKVLGEEEPSPPRTKAQAMLQHIVL